MYLFPRNWFSAWSFALAPPWKAQVGNIGGYSNVTSWEEKKKKNLLGRELLKRANKFFYFFSLLTRHIGIPTNVPTCAFQGGASAKDQAENQFLWKRYVCVTLLLGFSFSGKPNYEFPFIYNRGNPTSILGLTPNDTIWHPPNYRTSVRLPYIPIYLST